MSDRKNRTTWNEEFRVRAYEVGATAELRPDALFDYLQECAANHAHELGFSAAQMSDSGLVWVMSRLVVDMFRMPDWKELVKVTTWPSSTEGIFATRDFRVVDEGGTALAMATSAWFLIDTQRRKPVRLPPAVTGIQLPDEPRALVDDFARSPPLETDQADYTVVTGASHMDMNQHVNHVHYTAWMLDSVGERYQRGHRLRRIQLQFRSESGAGDTVGVFSESAGDSGFSWGHSVRGESGALLAQAQTDWEPRLRKNT